GRHAIARSHRAASLCAIASRTSRLRGSPRRQGQSRLDVSRGCSCTVSGARYFTKALVGFAAYLSILVLMLLRLARFDGAGELSELIGEMDRGFLGGIAVAEEEAVEHANYDGSIVVLDPCSCVVSSSNEVVNRLHSPSASLILTLA